MNMADRIKEKRLEHGYTQEELADKVGLQKSAIAKYEKGRVENIKRSMIQKLADALECSPAYLMGWEDNANSDDTSDIVVELLSNNRLLEYVIKLNSLSHSKREKAYGYIDCLSEMEN